MSDQAVDNFIEEGGQKRAKKFSFKELLTSLILIAAVFFTFHVVLGFVPVEGASMQPLINMNDERSTSVVCRLMGAERNAIVVFAKPNSDVNLIKRVVGMPGDEILVKPNETNPSKADLYLNGQLLEEDYLGEDMLWSMWVYSSASQAAYTRVWTLYGGFDSQDVPYIRMTVPEGKFFALGDNRNNSNDSRRYGFFDQSTIVGRVFVLVDSSGLRFI